MITGVAANILDAHDRGEVLVALPKYLLTKLVAVREARRRLDWSNHHRVYAPGIDDVARREDEIMREVEQYIIKKASL